MNDTTMGKGLQTAANVLSGLNFGKSRTYAFIAKPEYAAGATNAASLANTRLVDQVVALR